MELTCVSSLPKSRDLHSDTNAPISCSAWTRSEEHEKNKVHDPLQITQVGCTSVEEQLHIVPNAGPCRVSPWHWRCFDCTAKHETMLQSLFSHRATARPMISGMIHAWISHQALSITKCHGIIALSNPSKQPAQSRLRRADFHSREPGSKQRGLLRFFRDLMDNTGQGCNGACITIRPGIAKPPLGPLQT